MQNEKRKIYNSKGGPWSRKQYVDCTCTECGKEFMRRQYNASQAKTSRKKLGLPDTGHTFCGRACNLSYQRKKRLGQLEE